MKFNVEEEDLIIEIKAAGLLADATTCLAYLSSRTTVDNHT
jgi:hypothetical protein